MNWLISIIINFKNLSRWKYFAFLLILSVISLPIFYFHLILWMSFAIPLFLFLLYKRGLDGWSEHHTLSILIFFIFLTTFTWIYQWEQFQSNDMKAFLQGYLTGKAFLNIQLDLILKSMFIILLIAIWVISFSPTASLQKEILNPEEISNTIRQLRAKMWSWIGNYILLGWLFYMFSWMACANSCEWFLSKWTVYIMLSNISIAIFYLTKILDINMRITRLKVYTAKWSNSEIL